MNTKSAILTLMLVSASASAQTPQPADPELSRGSPVAFHWGEIDGDTLMEAIALGPSGDVRLLRNRGDGHLIDCTLGAGLGDVHGATQVLFGDFNADRRDDALFVLSSGSARLFSATNNGTFMEVGPESGLDFGDWISAEWFDYDRDGWLDLRVAAKGGDRLYHNERGTFRQASLGFAGSRAAKTHCFLGGTPGRR